MGVLRRGAAGSWTLLVLLWSTVIVGCTFGFGYVAVLLRVIAFSAFGDAPDAEQLDDFATFILTWPLRAVFFLTVWFVSSRAARTPTGSPFLRALGIGLTAAVLFQIVVVLLDTASAFELAVYVLFGLAGGYLGGGAASRADELLRTARGLRRARNPWEIAAAVGRSPQFVRAAVVSLWQPLDVRHPEERNAGSPGAFRLAAWWDRSGGEAPDQILRIHDPVVRARLAERASTALRVRRLPAADRLLWEASGIRLILIVPLRGEDERCVGLLVAGHRSRTRPAQSTTRKYLFLSEPAAIALEKFRHAEEARGAGELRERARLSREIHATLTQGFSTVGMNLQAALQASEPWEFFEGGDARGQIERALRTADHNLREARRLVADLDPEALERNPLHEALETVARDFSDQTGLSARATTMGSPRRLPREIEIVLLRAAQEGLNNARKHADPGQIALTLSYADDRVLLDVFDDGKGFNPEREMAHDSSCAPGASDSLTGFGLRHMAASAEQLGGNLLIESAPGEGTVLSLRLPNDSPQNG